MFKFDPMEDSVLQNYLLRKPVCVCVLCVVCCVLCVVCVCVVCCVLARGGCNIDS